PHLQPEDAGRHLHAAARPPPAERPEAPRPQPRRAELAQDAREPAARAARRPLMSFFRSLFGRKTAADFEAEADAALAAGDFGGAKLLFDRALERADADARPRLDASVAK